MQRFIFKKNKTCLTKLLSLRRIFFKKKMHFVIVATTCTPVELLGPCYKTGRIVESFFNLSIKNKQKNNKLMTSILMTPQLVAKQSFAIDSLSGCTSLSNQKFNSFFLLIF